MKRARLKAFPSAYTQEFMDDTNRLRKTIRREVHRLAKTWDLTDVESAIAHEASFQAALARMAGLSTPKKVKR